MRTQCALVDTWLYSAAGGWEQAAVPDDLVAHLSGCPRCRMALVTLIADRMGPPVLVGDHDCAAIEAQIPAFVDYERAYGLLAAARAFRDVWWHSLTCAGCDELYRTLQEVLAAPERLPAADAQIAPAPAWIEMRVELHPALLRQFLGLQRLGARMGSQPEQVMIAEQRETITLVKVLLRQDAPASLAIIVQTDPPAIGAVVLSLGEARYAAQIDAQGEAVFAGIAAAQLGGGQQISLQLRPAAP